MIIRSLSDELLFFTQTDHAALAAELLSLWREDGLADHPRRRELLLAVREHDNGWREADAAPRTGDDGRPHDFLSLPERERRELWDRGVRRWIDGEPWVARLILRHAIELHRGHAEDDAWAGLLGAWSELDESLAERTDHLRLGSSEEREDDYSWLALADELSLRLCQGWTGEIERRGRRIELRADEVALEPFPFAGSTSFRILARRLPDGAWNDDSSFAVALASTRWERRTVRVVSVAGAGAPRA